MPQKMRRKVRQNMGFLLFMKNDFELKVTNKTTHNSDVVNKKNCQIAFLTPFCNPTRYFALCNISLDKMIYILKNFFEVQ